MVCCWALGGQCIGMYDNLKAHGRWCEQFWCRRGGEVLVSTTLIQGY